MIRNVCRRGFTLTELLIVIAILALLIALGLTNWNRQLGRGIDARKKQDLQQLKIALEQYNNDHGCYPLQGVMVNCKTNLLAPYIQSIPCDPDSNSAYMYLPVDPNTICHGYKLLTKLHNTSDPDIVRVGCSPTSGCAGDIRYNYGVSEGGGVGQ